MKVSVPGKLMVAGEFAVLEPYQPLVVMAVNRFVQVQLNPATTNELSLLDFNLERLAWHWNSQNVIISEEDSRLRFVQQAMEVSLRYLEENQVVVTPVQLQIHSELDDASGVKYGLGSSAAVVTGVVRSLLTYFLTEKPTDMLVFKIASIAHVITQGNGSGADIAAASFHGVLKYTSFQAEWLLREWEETSSVTDLVRKTWDYLTLERVEFPRDLQVLVGWTGTAASTKHLVAKIKKMKNTAYETFLQESKNAVSMILAGMANDDSPLFLQGIETNRKVLSDLGRIADVPIETRRLYQLAKTAESFHGAGKLSGAGGGDCGIVFVSQETAREEVYVKWGKSGILPLELTVYHGIVE
ncbi:MAG TPA: phosphomevalonate kinase [Pseudogracilibacillus sp.]|nr:phosphomevalonate kinase [Pseudogracilibacillus sp.]